MRFLTRILILFAFSFIVEDLHFFDMLHEESPYNIVSAKKVGFKLNPDKKAKEKNLSTQLTKGPVAKNDSSILRLIILSGYDKHASSSVESFFISNKSDHNISGITLDINYLTPDNRQLHKRTEEIILYIPAGETRMAEIKSWDKQKSFHYIKSQPSRKPSSPYKVTITPLSVLIDK